MTALPASFMKDVILRVERKFQRVNERSVSGIRIEGWLAGVSYAEWFALADRVGRAETELLYTHDRGDHLVYRDEWEAFNAWQRGSERAALLARVEETEAERDALLRVIRGAKNSLLEAQCRAAVTEARAALATTKEER